MSGAHIHRLCVCVWWVCMWCLWECKCVVQVCGVQVCAGVPHLEVFSLLQASGGNIVYWMAWFSSVVSAPRSSSISKELARSAKSQPPAETHQIRDSEGGATWGFTSPPGDSDVSPLLSTSASYLCPACFQLSLHPHRGYISLLPS